MRALTVVTALLLVSLSISIGASGGPPRQSGDGQKRAILGVLPQEAQAPTGKSDNGSSCLTQPLAVTPYTRRAQMAASAQSTLVQARSLNRMLSGGRPGSALTSSP